MHRTTRIRKAISLLTVTCMLHTGIMNVCYAYPAVGARIKPSPVTSDLTPESLPQFPATAFSFQRYFNRVDPETAHLHVTHRDFELAGVDGLNVSFVRYYNSSLENEGAFGAGWFWPLETRIERQDKALLLTNEIGERISFSEKSQGKFVSLLKGVAEIRADADGFVRKTPDEITYRYDADGRLKDVAGRNGARVDLQYADGRIARIVDSVERKIDLRYGGNGRLEAVTLPSGHVLRYGYDAQGRLTGVHGLFGESVEYKYENGRIARINYPEQRSASFAYEPDTGRVVSHEGPEGYRATYRFDANRKTLTVSEPGERQTRYTFDKESLRVTNAEGHTERVVWHPRFTRLPAQVLSPGGGSSTFAYTEDGKLADVENGLGKRLRFSYDKNRRLERIQSPGGAQLQFEYDERGNLRAYTDANNQRIELHYNPNGTVAKLIDARKQVYRLHYDVHGRQTKIEGPGELLVENEYDSFDRVTQRRLDGKLAESAVYEDAERRVRITRRGKQWSEVQYDAAGLPAKAVDSSGASTTYRYNGHGLLSEVVDTLGSVTRYQYSAFAKLTRVELPGGEVYEYGYDRLNRLQRQVDPSGNVMQYAYDVGGQLIERGVGGTDPVRYGYDALGRLATVSYGDQPVSRFEYNDDNQMIAAVRGGHHTALSPDPLGRLNAINVTDEAGRKRQFGLAWNGDSEIEKIVYPSGLAAQYEYDDRGVLSALRFNGKAVELEQGADGQVIRYPNGVTGRYLYDDAERVVAMEISDAKGKVLLKHRYAYREDGNLGEFASGFAGEKERGYSYAYDRLGQLAQVNESGGEPIAYRYDADGDRIERQAGADKVQAQFEAGRLKRQGDVSYGYDAAGNTTRIDAPAGAAELDFSPLNELLAWRGSEGEVAYGYDALGHRVARKTRQDSASYDYVLDHRVTETRPDGKSREYIYAPGADRLIAMRDGKKYYYYHLDRLNNVVLITDGQGQVANRYAYLPFGETTVRDEQVPNPFRFTGRFQDSQSGLYDFRTRFYQPEAGRFLSEDEFPAFAGVPQSLNRYAYVFNNPNRYRDPNGEFVHLVVGGLIGAAVNVAITGATGGIDNFGDVAKAAIAGGAVGVAGAATGGASLLVQAAGAGGASVAGQVAGTAVGNTINGKPAFDGLSARELAIDAILSGGVAYGVGRFFPRPRGFRPVWARSPN
ncbi:MAG: RHS repeat-associated core domain-containing protein, partial [Gammaproteobacteria bacterium]